MQDAGGRPPIRDVAQDVLLVRYEVPPKSWQHQPRASSRFFPSSPPRKRRGRPRFPTHAKSFLPFSNGVCVFRTHTLGIPHPY
ncbi:hypothetical protein CSPX01_12087 [Colletotrichum filicis]|nr:hypothetical protein CSPX01_12087 [Colletotrichum filicis]